MNPLRASGPLLCSFLLLALSVLSGATASEWEIDHIATVDRIIDGDTLVVVSVGRVRLADIDTPELGEPGAREATDYLASLVHNRLAYLDVDDLYGTDAYHRVVAVVYVRRNATHLLNVNEALLRAGLAGVADLPNEFDPTTWALYVFHPAEMGTSVEDLSGVRMAGVAIVSVTASAIALLVSRHRRRRPPVCGTSRS